MRGIARAHPSEGWLRLRGNDYRLTMDRLLLERDRLNDPQHVGPAPAFLAWVADEQLPALARDPHYRQQIEQHLAELEAAAAAHTAAGEGYQRAMGDQTLAITGTIAVLSEVLA
jgi:hypothetical protein